MGWEKRRGQRLYYYHSERVGDRVKKVYLGNGSTAHMLAEADARLAFSERKQRELERDEWERVEVHDAAVEALCEVVDLVVRAALMEAGYHQHRRGEWRKSRAKKEACQEAEQ